MKIFAAFPSKYLKAADLHDKHIPVIMSHVVMEELVNKDGAELLPILYFEAVPKGMVLNVTNSKTIAAAYGDETDAWKGKPIVIFPAMVAFGAETREGIRMKVPPPRQGGPTARERQQAFISAQPDPAAAAERMAEAWGERAGEGLLRGLRQQPLADAIVWDETAERAPTEDERREQLTEQLRESLARANTALEERRAGRGAANPDGMDIPGFLQRAKPKEPEYNQNSWIELMQAAE